MFTQTTSLKKILALKKRLRIIQGGSSAGKTIAILLILIDIAQSSKTKKTISVVSETMPHLKRGAVRDFLTIMQEHNYYKDKDWNKTDYIYTFPGGSKIEFFSADSSDKVRGPRRDILFLNEANNIHYETYTQLAIRTNDFIYIDFNPVSSFWVHESIMPTLEHDFIILNYKDNEGLPETIVQEIESRKGNKNFWKVYGLGELGEAEGRIYTGWQIIDEIPWEARLERYGLDFGYTNDPTAIVAVYKHNDTLLLDEITYQTRLLNSDIADILKNVDRALVIADSAEPKSIEEISLAGINILGATKGPGSVLQGIQKVQDQKIAITKRSTNIIKEYRNFLWMTDKEGKTINEPSPINDHTMNAIMYAVVSLNPAQSYVPAYNKDKWRIK